MEIFIVFLRISPHKTNFSGRFRVKIRIRTLKRIYGIMQCFLCMVPFWYHGEIRRKNKYRVTPTVTPICYNSIIAAVSASRRSILLPRWEDRYGHAADVRCCGRLRRCFLSEIRKEVLLWRELSSQILSHGKLIACSTTCKGIYPK